MGGRGRGAACSLCVVATRVLADRRASGCCWRGGCARRDEVTSPNPPPPVGEKEMLDLMAAGGSLGLSEWAVGVVGTDIIAATSIAHDGGPAAARSSRKA